MRIARAFNAMEFQPWRRRVHLQVERSGLGRLLLRRLQASLRRGDLHRDPAGFGAVERAGDVAVERGPGFLVDLGAQRGCQRFVRVLGAEEVGVADEETLLVVVGVDEPGGDALGVAGADVVPGSG